MSWITWTSLYLSPPSQKRGEMLLRLLSCWCSLGMVWLVRLMLALILADLNKEKYF